MTIIDLIILDFQAALQVVILLQPGQIIPMRKLKGILITIAMYLLISHPLTNLICLTIIAMKIQNPIGMILLQEGIGMKNQLVLEILKIILLIKLILIIVF